MFLIVKIILLRLASVLSALVAFKTQYFVHLVFSSILQLINRISSDIQKLFKYFNCTAIVVYFRILFASLASVFPNDLAF